MIVRLIREFENISKELENKIISIIKHSNNAITIQKIGKINNFFSAVIYIPKDNQFVVPFSKIESYHKTVLQQAKDLGIPIFTVYTTMFSRELKLYEASFDSEGIAGISGSCHRFEEYIKKEKEKEKIQDFCDKINKTVPLTKATPIDSYSETIIDYNDEFYKYQYIVPNMLKDKRLLLS